MEPPPTSEPETRTDAPFFDVGCATNDDGGGSASLAGDIEGADRDATTPEKIVAIADGATGTAAAGAASQIAIETLGASLMRPAERPLGPRERLIAAIRDCQTAVVADAAQSGYGPAEAAVSLTAGLITWPALTVAHAGDCRAYLWRDGHLEQLTADDTVAERVVEREIPDPADIAERSAALTNVIGAAAGELDVHVCEREVELGDQLVICSGPLARNLGALEISDIVGSSITAATAARRLVDRAAGGESVTAIVLRAQDIT